MRQLIQCAFYKGFVNAYYIFVKHDKYPRVFVCFFLRVSFYTNCLNRL